MKIKKMMSLVAIALCSLCAIAGENRDAVRVWKPDGGSEVFLLSARPVVTFTEDELLFAAGNVTLSYPLAACAKFTFEKYGGQTEGLEEAETRTPVVALTEYGLQARNLTLESVVCIYDVQGQLLRKEHADGNGSLDVGDFADTGVFIIKTDGSTFKMIRK